nr:hypothetical protein [Alkalilimnicola ehrlichii]
MGHGKDSVEMIARQQAASFTLHPLCLGTLRTLRAATMPARVVLHAAVVAMGTTLLVAPQRFRPAIHNRFCRFELRERKTMMFTKPIKMLQKYVLNGRLPCH